ncbi:MAG: V-type ATP synthase subunit E family protein [Thermoplasmata archaeon]
MSLDRVIKNILETGKAEAKGIVMEGQKERERQIKEARKEGKKLLDSKIEESNELIQRMRMQEIARAELESKKIVLSGQKEVLDTIYEKALERLGNLPRNESLLRSLISQNREEIKDGRVFCNQRDAEFVRSLVGTNFAGTIDCVGGLVVESRNGRRRIDLRYETSLREIWNDSIKEISDLLWGSE